MRVQRAKRGGLCHVEPMTKVWKGAKKKKKIMKRKRISVYHTVVVDSRRNQFLYTLRNRNQYFYIVGNINVDKMVVPLGYIDRLRRQEKLDRASIMEN